MEYFLIKSLEVLGIIIFLTFLQWFYYKLLFYIWKNTIYIFRKFIDFIVRIWVIIHEFAHMFFAFLSWNKIIKVDLFSKNGWSVQYAYKNYIWAIWDGFWYLSFWLMLILNQIGIFLTSLWPFIFGLWITYFFFDYFLNIHNIEWLESLDLKWYLYLFLYAILIPSFALSWKDISHFIISKQNWFLATLIWSIINFTIFMAFLFLFSFFLDYLIIFSLIYSMYFVIILIVAIFVYIIKKVKYVFT